MYLRLYGFELNNSNGSREWCGATYRTWIKQDYQAHMLTDNKFSRRVAAKLFKSCCKLRKYLVGLCTYHFFLIKLMIYPKLWICKSKKMMKIILRDSLAECTKTITYHRRLFLERDAWVKAVSREKDSFHSGISLQKGMSVVGYGLRTATVTALANYNHNTGQLWTVVWWFEIFVENWRSAKAPSSMNMGNPDTGQCFQLFS